MLLVGVDDTPVDNTTTKTATWGRLPAVGARDIQAAPISLVDHKSRQPARSSSKRCKSRLQLLLSFDNYANTHTNINSRLQQLRATRLLLLLLQPQRVRQPADSSRRLAHILVVRSAKSSAVDGCRWSNQVRRPPSRANKKPRPLADDPRRDVDESGDVARSCIINDVGRRSS